MSTTAQPPPAQQTSKFEKCGISRVLSSVGYMFFWTALLFVSAGTLHWRRGWICSLSYFVIMLGVGLAIWRHNPTLFAARGKWRRSDTKLFDKIFLPFFFVFNIGQPAIAGLDVMRFHWSTMPFWTVYLGLALFASAMLFVTSVLAVNPWAESTVRIQTDRGQQVVRSGPYRLVRHPMYLGTIVMYPSVALMLGSMWALADAAAIAVLFIIRTALEDRTLRRELPGYEDYTLFTRWRLFPGIW